mmetsp:Transcript_98942/g.284281  ORF Transcript_98942/g.284281 Transcript_98942/m.284281 type:complete len:267 (-) Transcript_98942:1742-2542(-)
MVVSPSLMLNDEFHHNIAACSAEIRSSGSLQHNSCTNVTMLSRSGDLERSTTANTSSMDLPKANTSARSSSALSFGHCGSSKTSGAAYEGVNILTPVVDRPRGIDAQELLSLAVSKSFKRGVPEVEFQSQFDGFKSPWTTPCRCKCATDWIIACTIRRTAASKSCISPAPGLSRARRCLPKSVVYLSKCMKARLAPQSMNAQRNGTIKGCRKRACNTTSCKKPGRPRCTLRSKAFSTQSSPWKLIAYTACRASFPDNLALSEGSAS